MEHYLSLKDYQVGLHMFPLQVTNPTYSEKYVLNSLLRQRPRAVVCYHALLHEESLHALQQYEDQGEIVVDCSFSTGAHRDGVTFNTEHNTYCATKHLLS